MTNIKSIKTKSRKPRKAAYTQEGNLFILKPYAEFVSAKTAELLQTRGGRFA